jgi:hypothetical protein
VEIDILEIKEGIYIYIYKIHVDRISGITIPPRRCHCLGECIVDVQKRSRRVKLQEFMV